MAAVGTRKSMEPAGRRFDPRTFSMRLNGVLFTLPAMLLVGLVMVLPLGQAAYYSFTNWNGARADWTGWTNYLNMLYDPELRRSLVNSLCFLASVPFGLIPPFIVAYLLHKDIPGNRLFRALIFAPTALSWVVIGMVGRQFFALRGPLSGVVGLLGLSPPNWLADSSFALAAVILTFNAAIFGINTIIFLTGLATVDRSTIEAAWLDGASERQVIWYVILPAMRRFVEFVLIITVITSATGIFAMIFTMTGGGPGSATLTLEFAVWRRAFATGGFGAGAAIGITLMVVTLVAVGLIRLLARDRSQA
ncbi:MAG TPA: sugar ABC transporter permease [Devosia sp.]|nr:sugar ABC transporter permease [Devosia sp.]